MMMLQNDADHIRRCIELSKESVANGDWPYGALIVNGAGKVLAEAMNTAKNDITGHAEANVIRNVLQEHKEEDPSACTLYSNFEPCPMCSFLIREYGIGRVVFSLKSPHWGGYSRWSVLKDSISPNAFVRETDGAPPDIVSDVLAEEAAEVLESIGWSSHRDIL